MNQPSSLLSIIAASLALLLANCANKSVTMGPDGKPVDAKGKATNPFPPGTYDHFKAEPDYPKTMQVWKNDKLLAETNAENSHIEISLSKQRGFFMKGDEVVIDYPVSSGVPSRPTPPGDYKILEKQIDKASNNYGKAFDAEGNQVDGETPAAVPEGGKFVGSPMPYWMRLTWDGVGHHIGPLPKSRRPASHACVRGPRAVIPIVYDKVKVGTPVSVKED
ncbi:L,D-transpeptidase [Haloferula sp. BvORR071]|uniref:L,D-transpeptidase n=1 Tax=Haloferula sp. BvORR071 TaxID=1396141 RepID=UPI0006965C3C|nr:L,D-transpeptidase [Haloferula sp. BvORR071]